MHAHTFTFTCTCTYTHTVRSLQKWCVSVTQPALVTGDLHTLLLGMSEESVDERVSLEHILSSCQQHIGDSAREEVEKLVTYILGPSNDVSSYCAPVVGAVSVSYPVPYSCPQTTKIQIWTMPTWSLR